MSPFVVFSSINPFAWQEKSLSSPYFPEKQKHRARCTSPGMAPGSSSAFPRHSPPRELGGSDSASEDAISSLPAWIFFPCNLFVSRAADREVRAPYKHVRSRFLPGWRAKHRRCSPSRSHPECWVGRAPHAPCETLRLLLPPWQGEKLQNQQIHCLSISEMLLPTSPRSCLSLCFFICFFSFS